MKSRSSKSSGAQRDRRRRRSSRRGASVVEFALVAPVFVLLLLGMLEFGRMVMVQQVLVNATREGARQAILEGATEDEVNARVQEYLDLARIRNANIQLSKDPATAARGEPIEVEVSVPFQSVSWLPTPFMLKDTTLSASTVMGCEVRN